MCVCVCIRVWVSRVQRKREYIWLTQCHSIVPRKDLRVGCNGYPLVSALWFWSTVKTTRPFQWMTMVFQTHTGLKLTFYLCLYYVKYITVLLLVAMAYLWKERYKYCFQDAVSFEVFDSSIFKINIFVFFLWTPLYLFVLSHTHLHTFIYMFLSL